MPLIVHLINFSGRNTWIEEQMAFFRIRGQAQGLITISGQGEIHEVLRQNGFEKIQNVPHSVFGLFQACSILRKWTRNEKVYVYAHGHLASIYASCIRSFTGIEFIICHHQQPEYFSLLRSRTYFRATLHMALSRFYLVRARKIQSLSSEVTRSLNRKKVNSSKIVEIPLGMNFERFSGFVEEIRPIEFSKEIRIVSISRLVWEKRINLGIQSVAQLLKSGVSVNYSIVGEGPERSNLEALIRDLGVEKQVKVLGRSDNINEILNSSNILFHLSLTESYGQVLMEARLAGVPIFSSACGVALEMKELQDPIVHIFHSSNPLAIADELYLFLRKIQTQSSLYIPNPVELYKNHEYRFVLQNVEKMVNELLEYESKKKCSRFRILK